MPLAGLLSGLITAGLVYPAGRLGMSVPGGVFGVAMAITLSVCRVPLRPWRAILLAVAAAVAYYLSWCTAAIVELGFSGGNSMGQPFDVSPVTMFVGGAVGGFVVLVVILRLVGPKVAIRTLAEKAVIGSLVAGSLGVIGWSLGPSLGMAIWSVLHGMSLTFPTETFQNALEGQTSHGYSLFVVWQTGMALMLAVMLQRYKPQSPEGVQTAKSDEK
jgi:hypothetical protein